MTNPDPDPDATEYYIPAESCWENYPNNFWMCVLGLMGIIFLFRLATVLILAAQECKCRKNAGDTRNMPTGRINETH